LVKKNNELFFLKLILQNLETNITHNYQQHGDTENWMNNLDNIESFIIK
jgi:hypothetical protein